ncbi:MAG: (d)CMP kinase [Caldimicrobium sp.]|jgi:cytidylate kinase
MNSLIITIDGPAGSGKTTVAKTLAKTLKLDLLESGSFYRYVTWCLLKEQKNINNFSTDEDLKNYLKEIFNKINISLSSDGTNLIFNGKVLKEELRAKEVDNYVSEVAAHPLVREEVTQFLRRLVEGRRVITEGRDMGSVVFPEASLKIYLTADLEERARRRAKDIPDRDLVEVKKNLLERDLKDSKREVAPLRIPEGAIIIDTTHLSLNEVVQKIEKLIKERL